MGAMAEIKATYLAVVEWGKIAPHLGLGRSLSTSNKIQLGEYVGINGCLGATPLSAAEEPGTTPHSGSGAHTLILFPLFLFRFVLQKCFDGQTRRCRIESGGF